MYAQPQRVDALDRFLGASPYSPYSALSSPTGANMAAAAVQQPPAYGARECLVRSGSFARGPRCRGPTHQSLTLTCARCAAGSFAGRKAIQPPGGFSSLSIGDGSNYSPYGAASAAPRYGQGYAAAPSAYLGAQQVREATEQRRALSLLRGCWRLPASRPSRVRGLTTETSAAATQQGSTRTKASTALPRTAPRQASGPRLVISAPQGGYGSDLSSHLNLQGGAGRRPPSAGRRAVSQPAYGGGYGAAGGYGGGYGGGAGGYGGAAGGYGYGAGSYGADASAYGAYQGASGYGAAGAYSSPYGAAAGGASPYGGLSSPSARSPGAYGGGSAAYGAGAYGASSYGAAGYGSSAYGSAGSYDAYGGASGGGGAARGQGGGSSNYIPSAAYTPTFVPGQKGQVRSLVGTSHGQHGS